VKREAALAALMAVLATAVFLEPLWHHWDWPGARDWAIWMFYEVTAKKAVVDHGEFPLWNPFACGGEPYHAHPFTRALAPLSPIHWLVGHPRAALRVEAALTLAATAWIGYLLSRREGLQRGGAALAAAVAAFGGAVVGRLWAGHLGLLQLPWVLLAVWAARLGPSRPRRAVALGAVAIALCVFAAGNYLAVCAALLIGLDGLWDAFAARRARPLAVVVAILALGFALSAAKIVPTLDFLSDCPRLTSGLDPFAPGGPLLALVAPLRLQIEGAAFGWHEYAAYVGWIPLLLAAAAPALAPRRAAKPAVLFAVLAVIAWGDFARFAPWSQLHRLPVVDSMRIPARFLLVAAIPLGWLAGLGLDAIADRLPGRVARLATWVVPAVLLDLVLSARPLLGQAFVRPSPPYYTRGVTPDGTFRLVRGTPSQMAEAAEAELGTVRCAEGVPIVRSKRLRTPTQRGYRGEAWIAGEGTARITRRSFNEIDVAVDVLAARGATLVVNQNFDRRWTSSVGSVRNLDGVLTVPLPPGENVVRLRYRPRSVVVGLAASAVALVPLGWCLLPRRRRRGAIGGAAPGP
jgi:hypothetical protein